MATVRVCILALCTAIAVSPAFALSRYVAVPLGTLGGDVSAGLAINAHGHVTGYAQTPAGDLHAFVHSGTGMIDLVPGATSSAGNGINDMGQVAVTSTLVGQDGVSAEHAFLYSHGVVTDVGSLAGLPTSARGINAGGAIVGVSYVTPYLYRAFLYSGGNMFDLGTLGDPYSYGIALNDSGAAVGWSGVPGPPAGAHAFRSFGLVMIDLGTLGGGASFSYAYAINSRGDVVGESSAAGNGSLRAVLFRNGAVADLGTLGGSSSSAWGINDTGAIVGSSALAGDHEEHAFVHDGGSMQDLNTLVTTGLEGAVLTVARAINRNGQIAANACKPFGDCRAFRLDPVAEPPAPPIPAQRPLTLAVLALLLATAGVRRLRRARRC